MLARTRSASLRSLPHDGGSDDADLAAGSSTGQPAHGLTPGLDDLLRHEVSVASESMHGIQNPSEVRVDTQPRREREHMSTHANAPLIPEGRRRLWGVGKNAVTSRNRAAVARAKGRLRGLGVRADAESGDLYPTMGGVQYELTPEQVRKG